MKTRAWWAGLTDDDFEQRRTEMSLDRVTFTGADDSVDPRRLAAISKDYPIVEWGILFSRTSRGEFRFPSAKWLDVFGQVVTENPGMRVSAHLCGRYVREFVIDGRHTWLMENKHSHLFQRIQLNFHGEFHRQHDKFQDMLKNMPSTQIILQCDGVNDGSAREIVDRRLGVPLFDTSGGAGIVPDGWPNAWPGTYCGYAGGLGPQTLAREMETIELASKGQPYWIDMERRVRSEDDSLFDLDKVCDVLEQVANMPQCCA